MSLRNILEIFSVLSDSGAKFPVLDGLDLEASRAGHDLVLLALDLDQVLDLVLGLFYLDHALELEDYVLVVARGNRDHASLLMLQVVLVLFERLHRPFFMEEIVGRRAVVVVVVGERCDYLFDREWLVLDLISLAWDFIVFHNLDYDLRVYANLFCLRALQEDLQLLGPRPLDLLCLGELGGVVDEPRVASDVCKFEAIGGVGVQDFGYEIAAVLSYVSRERVLALYDFLVELVRVGVFEWQVAAQHRIQDDSAGPDVDLQTLIGLASYHLWRCVARTATSRLEQICRL